MEVRGREWRRERGGFRVDTGHPAWNLCLFLAAAHLEQVLHCLKLKYVISKYFLLSELNVQRLL